MCCLRLAKKYNNVLIDCNEKTNENFNRYKSNETLSWKTMVPFNSQGDHMGSDLAREKAFALR